MPTKYTRIVTYSKFKNDSLQDVRVLGYLQPISTLFEITNVSETVAYSELIYFPQNKNFTCRDEAVKGIETRQK